LIRTEDEARRSIRSLVPFNSPIPVRDFAERDGVDLSLALEERAFAGTPIEIGEVVVVTWNAYGAAWIEAGLGRHYRLRRILLAGAVIAL
jgi:hypothetical protein